MPQAESEPSKIVPLLSKGQAENFFTYQAIGTGLFWALGGLTSGFSLVMVAACGLGAVMNRGSRNDCSPDQETNIE
ncbi:MAG: hypothetical protein IT428_30385 [Planctomycetaceae bacterium]|nr:hypothetical protein [Planctomycetaceae bacterium]